MIIHVLSVVLDTTYNLKHFVNLFYLIKSLVKQNKKCTFTIYN